MRHAPRFTPTASLLSRKSLFLGVCLLAGTSAAHALQIDVAGPAGSDSFGTRVKVLPNGNIVVTDPTRSVGGLSNVGAVYLYSPDGALISTLTGSSAGDFVGSSGITVLSNGNYVIGSISWDHNGIANVGAATWASATAGISGVVSAANSLIGSSANDQVGGFGTTALSNGNYVVTASAWDNAGTANVGAVTWGNGSTGVVGTVSASNSLIGGQANDLVGSSIVALNNGNYVVVSINWNNGNAVGAGAVTWGNGAGGSQGVVNSSNSLTGIKANDMVGSGGVFPLNNGNYVVVSDQWDGSASDVGAVSLGNGLLGTSGVITAQNSLVGSNADDRIGSFGVVATGSGSYVVISPLWDNGAQFDVGAVTACPISGRVGPVGTNNSLIGGTNGDQVGSGGVEALNNGGYVISSPNWKNGGLGNVGAVTHPVGIGGNVGIISSANSLIGSHANDFVGAGGTTALSGGNFVVSSPMWDSGATADVGAVTWGNGSLGLANTVSSSNSLIGNSAGDRIGSNPSGSRSVIALSNGNYVVVSPFWSKPGLPEVGAVTWADGSSGLIGSVSVSNSLVGSSADDRVGNPGVRALTTGGYMVSSMLWDSASKIDVGAVTWASGTGPTSGTISAANSMVGSTDGDRVGSTSAAADSGHMVVGSSGWQFGAIADAGVITLARENGLTGPVPASNSVRGTVDGGGIRMAYGGYDAAREQIAVGRPDSNLFSILRLDSFLIDGFE